MSKFLIFGLLFFVSTAKLFAQVNSQEFLDGKFWNLNLVNNSPIGKYKDGLKNDFVKVNSVGLALSYFFNPLYNSSINNKVFLGLELGFSNKQQEKFRFMPIDRDCYIGHNEYWTNVLLRYRPNTFVAKFSPYIETFFGPRMFNSKIMIRNEESEAIKFKGFVSSTINFGLNVGCGYKISSNYNSTTYLDVNLGYNQANSVKIIDRNLVGIDQNNTIVEGRKVLEPQSIFLKIGITRYLVGR